MSESLTLQLKTVKARLDNIYSLLELWNEYVKVIYMPESEITLMEILNRMKETPESQAYGNRVKDADTANKLNMLFGTDKGVQEDEAAAAEYETVNEAETSDSSSGIDEETVMKKHAAYESFEQERAKAAGDKRSALDLQL